MSRDITCKEGPWERARRYTLEKTGTIVVPRRPRYVALSVKSHRTTKWPTVDATSEPGDRRPRSKEIMSRDSRVLLPPLIPFPPMLPGIHSEGDTDVWSLWSCFAWCQANSRLSYGTHGCSAVCLLLPL